MAEEVWRTVKAEETGIPTYVLPSDPVMSEPTVGHATIGDRPADGRQLHHARAEPGSASTLARISDALPGLGIVAAVLGVVITMQAIDGPPAQIGHK